MSDFDPYYTWLGIPPADQPTNHYRLLGIELLEENKDVISCAADRQMGHLRTFQNGPHSVLSQKLLNEVAAARTCLLNAERKAEYDEQLVNELPEAQIEDLPEVELIEEPPVAASATQNSAPPTAPISERVLGNFGNFDLLEELDKSRTGALYKARHQKSGRLAALKVLSSKATQSDVLRRRFRRKVKILARLDHPNLVKVYDAGEHKGRPYMVMDYINGRNLTVLVGQVGPLPVAHAVSYTMQAATGLAFAHAHGVYHRNVKPSNLLVDNQSGLIKVIGLGMAKLSGGPLASGASMDDLLTAPGTTMGTFDYMAPEQFQDTHNVDHRADIYSLGCTLYVLLTGKLPYPVKSPMKKLLAHRDAPIPPLADDRSEVPPALEVIYQKMIAKNPNDRQQSMQDVAAALQSCS